MVVVEHDGGNVRRHAVLAQKCGNEAIEGLICSVDQEPPVDRRKKYCHESEHHTHDNGDRGVELRTRT